MELLLECEIDGVGTDPNDVLGKNKRDVQTCSVHVRDTPSHGQ